MSHISNLAARAGHPRCPWARNLSVHGRRLSSSSLSAIATRSEAVAPSVTRSVQRRIVAYACSIRRVFVSTSCSTNTPPPALELALDIVLSSFTRCAGGGTVASPSGSPVPAPSLQSSAVATAASEAAAPSAQRAPNFLLWNAATPCPTARPSAPTSSGVRVGPTPVLRCTAYGFALTTLALRDGDAPPAAAVRNLAPGESNASTAVLKLASVVPDLTGVGLASVAVPSTGSSNSTRGRSRGNMPCRTITKRRPGLLTDTGTRAVYIDRPPFAARREQDAAPLAHLDES